MNLTIDGKVLAEACKTLHQAAGRKTGIAALHGILLVTENESLLARAGNGEVWVRFALPARIEKPGAVLLPADRLLAIVQECKASMVSLQVSDKGQATFKIPGGRWTLAGLGNPEDFPLPSMPDNASGYMIQASHLAIALRQTLYAVGQGDPMPFTQGVAVRTMMGSDKMRLAATDRARGTFVEALLAGASATTRRAMVARATAKLIQDVTEAHGGMEAGVLISDSKIAVAVGTAEIVAPLIAGEFPHNAMDAFLAQTPTTEVSLDSRALVQAIRRAAIMEPTVRLTVESDRTLVESLDENAAGDASIEIDSGLTGEPMRATVRASYLLSYFAAVGDGLVTLKRSGAGGPVLVQIDGGPPYFVMPIAPPGKPAATAA